jgi:hypothetical protein
VELLSRRSGVMEALEEVQQKFDACKVRHTFTKYILTLILTAWEFKKPFFMKTKISSG